jgi:hypothetical protein
MEVFEKEAKDIENRLDHFEMQLKDQIKDHLSRKRKSLVSSIKMKREKENKRLNLLRLLQEREDKKLALKLQKEFNQ